MLPVITIVGRPNVGKSTLFNALTRTRDALVADMPGVTRDRQYGIGQVGGREYLLVDTGGLVAGAEGIDFLTAQQVQQAIAEADVLLFIVSARDGLLAADQEIAQQLRIQGKPLVLVANKVDGLDAELALADFAALGMGSPQPVAASHRRGLSSLAENMLELCPPLEQDSEAGSELDEHTIKLAIVGRPNVGKSTLVNRLLGEERVLAYDLPGTTRDTISVQLQRDGQDYLLLDTAGVRRRAKVTEAVEKFSVIKALKAIQEAHVVVLMLDAGEGVTEQDSTLLGHILQQGRAFVIALNKWDGLEQDHRDWVKSDLLRRFSFVQYARHITLSALHGSGLQHLMVAVNKAYVSATRDFSTSELTRVLQRAFERHQPPMKQGRTAKLRYAHAGGKLPPRIIVHGSRVNTIPAQYTRYLENRFIQHFKLEGTPVVIDYREGANPFKNKKNTLTQRQVAKRKRLKKFTKRRK